MITRKTGLPYLDAQGWGQSGQPLAFAHRGGALHPDLIGLENSLKSFQHAASLGYTYLETDVHVTSDGVLIAFHDDDLSRVTDHRGRIGELTSAQVAEARIGGTEPVPTLAELFDALPDARFNIDLKSDMAVDALASFLDEREVHDRVMVGSFVHARIARFRRITGGQVPTSASAREVAAHVLLPGPVARILTGGAARALQIPHRHERILVTSRRVVRNAHAAGMHVHVWTIDDPVEMGELLELGVDGLMTDRTDVLKDVLTARGLWKD